jgi:soluble cytochrome b562
MSTKDPSSAPDSKPVLEAETDPVVVQNSSEQNKNPKTKVQKVFATTQNFLTALSPDRARQLFWLVVLSATGLTGAIAFQWLSGLPPTPHCGKLFKATLSDSGQLYCADQAARKGDEASLSDALDLSASISEQNPLFEQSRRLSDHWSRSILLLARQKVETGDLKKGVSLAQKVPKTSEAHADAQAMIQDWQGNWKDGEAIFQKARDAIQNQEWDQATEQVRNLVQLNSDYWQNRADKIVAEISIEQEAFSKINGAQEFANSGNPEDIAKAIQMVSQIDPKRLARKRMAEKIDEWSQKLVDKAKAAQTNGDYEGVIKAAQKVPPSSKVANEASAYLQMGRAGTLPKDGTLWSAIQAYALATQIDPSTSVHGKSQDQRLKWEGQVQNWGQLAVAKWFAGLDQISGYHAGIDQANLITADQPRRVEAQTLIAFWNKQINTFPDRQFIARAKQMAVDNTIASLQSAIEEASKVLSGQPLRETAQALMVQWSDTVEKIQDQPILDEALALAKKGDLNAAIQAAGKIKSDRALYRDAQAAVGDWVAQIQAVEDRPILSEAEALANEGRLSEAISRAANIDPSRALYSEAQSRIASWADKRRQIENANRPSPSTEDNASPSDNEPPGPEPAPLSEQAGPSPENATPTEPPANTNESPPIDAPSESPVAPSETPFNP